MEKLYWFSIGFTVSQFVGLILTTTPEKARQNLRDWARLFGFFKGD
jgi:hypothetical protein